MRTGGCSVLVEEAQKQRGRDRPRGLTMWELPLRRPEGLGRFLGFQAEASGAFSPKQPLESLAGISRPGGETGGHYAAAGSPQDTREGESRGQGSPSLSVRTRKTASSLLCCACLRQGLRGSLHSPEGCSFGKAHKHKRPSSLSSPVGSAISGLEDSGHPLAFLSEAIVPGKEVK